MVVARIAWGTAVLVAIAAVLWRSRADILRMLEELPAWMLVASAAITCAAKFLLGENARIAAATTGIRLDYATATRLYNLSQLGKYVPGSIWQFVGRAAAYRGLGADYVPIRNSLVTESAWIIGGAAATAAVLSGPVLLKVLDESLPPLVRWWLAIGALLLAAALAGLLAWRRAQLFRYLRSAVPSVRALVVQAGIWTSLGLAFWVLVQACGIPAPASFCIGLFAAAYAIGFLVPIAPAGLGIRDGILALGLLPYAGAGEAIAVSAISRVVYLAVELLLVVVQDRLFRILGAGRRARAPLP
jgi:hypothetical protein